MKIIAFNGNLRKQWDTANLLEKALKGVKLKGTEPRHNNELKKWEDAYGIIC